MTRMNRERKTVLFLTGSGWKKSNQGQTALEYAVVIACIVAALVSMQVYIKRAISGKLRSAADEIGQQYDPGNTIGTSILEYDSETKTTVETKSELELGVDLNGDGDALDDNVFATETTADLISSTTATDVDETVGALGDSL